MTFRLFLPLYPAVRQSFLKETAFIWAKYRSFHQALQTSCNYSSQNCRVTELLLLHSVSLFELLWLYCFKGLVRMKFGSKYLNFPFNIQCFWLLLWSFMKILSCSGVLSMLGAIYLLLCLSCSREKELAKKYYDKLFKEYCIADLSRYKENKVGWVDEMVSTEITAAVGVE